MKKNDSAFFEELVKFFPEIMEEVLDEDWIGLIHVQIGAFTRFTQKAIDNNNILMVLKCFQFVNDIIENVEPKVEEALEISWIYHLTFKGNENLFELFPQKLKEIRAKLDKIEHELYLLKNPLLKKYLDEQSKR